MLIEVFYYISMVMLTGNPHQTVVSMEKKIFISRKKGGPRDFWISLVKKNEKWEIFRMKGSGNV